MTFVSKLSLDVFAALVVASVAPVVMSTAQAAQSSSPMSAEEAFYTIGKVRLEQVSETRLTTRQAQLEVFGAPALMSETPKSGTDLDALEVTIDQIINIGKKVWTIVDANKPVVTINQDNIAHAMPLGITSWSSLESWQAPVSRVYRMTYENLMGISVVDFSFRVVYTHGGSVKGKGRYLTNVSVVAADLDVIWGYNFDAKVSVPSVTNAGNETSPVAGMQLNIDWTIKTPLQHRQVSQAYYVRGDGAFLDLSNGTSLR